MNLHLSDNFSFLFYENWANLMKNSFIVHGKQTAVKIWMSCAHVLIWLIHSREEKIGCSDIWLIGNIINWWISCWNCIIFLFACVSRNSINSIESAKLNREHISNWVEKQSSSIAIRDLSIVPIRNSERISVMCNNFAVISIIDALLFIQWRKFRNRFS